VTARSVLRLKVPPGIGDFLWLWMKLVHLAEEVEIRVQMPWDDPYQRSAPLFDLLQPRIPFDGYSREFSTEQAVHGTFDVTRPSAELLQEAGAGVFYAPNHHLEGGGRVEEMLPDLPTAWRPPVAGSAKQEAVAVQMLQGKPLPIAVYTASHGAARHWGFWGPGRWLRFLEGAAERLELRAEDLTFVLIGAKFDREFLFDVARGLRDRGFGVVNQVGHELGIAVELIRRCAYLVGFPSGIPILSGLLGVPTLMFFPPHLERMRFTFVHPEDEASGRTCHVPFLSPEEALDRWPAIAGRFLRKELPA